MNLKAFVAICLPIMTYAAIKVDIEATASKDTSSAKVSGIGKHKITVKEIEAYGMTDEVLKKGIEGIMNARPGSVFVKRPTLGINAPKDDLYEEFDWPEVQALYEGIRVEEMVMNSEKIVLSHQEFENSQSNALAFSVDFGQSVEDNIDIEWSTGTEIEDILITFNFSTTETPTVLSITSHWGKNITNSKSKLIGPSSTIEAKLNPGEKAVVTMTVTRIVLSCNILYQTSFDGVVAINYPEEYQGHHFYSQPIGDVLEKAGLPRSLTSVSTVQVVLYTNDEITTNKE